MHESREAAGRIQLAHFNRRLGPDDKPQTQTQLKPMTKISLWPHIERHKPGNGRKGGEADGFRVAQICQAGVVVYWADDSDSAPRPVTLQKYLEKRRDRKRLISERMKRRIFLGLLLMALWWLLQSMMGRKWIEVLQEEYQRGVRYFWREYEKAKVEWKAQRDVLEKDVVQIDVVQVKN